MIDCIGEVRISRLTGLEECKSKSANKSPGM